ncbi:site-2 protease family protein [Sediminimonas qiaohouensis]|uniref:site-2 protease family protein n=1 Tax=Sediminimonas qiaohouensis TaxID=552061 RepID=UPI00146D14D1|nr:site-2 protease family protein [Sediminimonas qiaohouensis]
MAEWGIIRIDADLSFSFDTSRLRHRINPMPTTCCGSFRARGGRGRNSDKLPIRWIDEREVEMFTKKLDLFSILGFRVSLDFSWFLLAVLIVWSLSEAYFPSVIENLPHETAVVMGLGGAAGFFFSIIFHEFSHALVARRYDIPISGITLFIFGGVAEMEKEPPSAKSEFLMAIAGPIASYVLAVLFYAGAYVLPSATPDAPLAAVFFYLALINTVLATFNLLPAFPLDGGRVFRAAVWWWTDNLQKATSMAAMTGRILGTMLMALGVLSVIGGAFVAGMWQALIGLFIIGAAQSSEVQMVMKTLLQNVPVSRLMVADPVAVPSDTPVADMIEQYFYRFSHKVFPVVRDDTLLGSVRLHDVGQIPHEERKTLTAGHVLSRDSLDRTVTPESSVLDALDLMQEHNTSRLMVTRNGTLKGMLTMRDIMNYVTIRQEIGAAADTPRRA